MFADCTLCMYHSLPSKCLWALNHSLLYMCICPHGCLLERKFACINMVVFSFAFGTCAILQYVHGTDLCLLQLLCAYTCTCTFAYAMDLICSIHVY